MHTYKMVLSGDGGLDEPAKVLGYSVGYYAPGSFDDGTPRWDWTSLAWFRVGARTQYSEDSAEQDARDLVNYLNGGSR